MKKKTGAYIIIACNPLLHHQMKAIVDGSGDVAVFATQKIAALAAREIPTCRTWPFTIIDMERCRWRSLSEWAAWTKTLDSPAAHRSAA